MARILVSGNINIETTVRVDAFPVTYQPTTFTFNGVSSHVSAVGYNVTKALSTLGNDVRLLAVTGRDLVAQTIRGALATEGIDDQFVLGLAEQTPQSVVLYDADGRRQAFTDLKNVLQQEIPHDTFRTAARDCDALVLTNIAYNRGLLPLARDAAVPIVTDVHAISALEDSYNQPFMEAANILFMSGEKLTEPVETWAERVLERYAPQVLVIGLGANGALLATPNMPPKHIPAVTPRAVISTGGAGDALLAAFLHSYLATNDVETAIRRAVVFAGYKIGVASSGEGFLSHTELEELLQTL